MTIGPTEHARLAALFLAEQARGTAPAASMGAALAQLAAERAAPDDRTAAIIAAVEDVLDIDLRARDRRGPSDVTRSLAYWVIHREGVSVADLARAISRNREGLYASLKSLGASLLTSAELRARLAWAKGQLNERQRKERAA